MSACQFLQDKKETYYFPKKQSLHTTKEHPSILGKQANLYQNSYLPGHSMKWGSEVHPLSNQVPQVIQGSKVAPFSLSISQCRRQTPPSSPPYMAIPLFMFFVNPWLFARHFLTILSLQGKNNNKLMQELFFIFRRLKNNIKCFFIINTFISNSRLRFNLK